ncbi:hypothetical protein MBLNU459_g6586t1 [Dothideomycetes sp. NU459]
MPASIAILGHDASGDSTGSTSPDMTSPRPSSRAAERSPICETDHIPALAGDGKPKHPVSKQSWDYVFRSGLAGGLAGCAAKTVVGPLDRVKILFQASNPQFAKYTGSWLGAVKAMRDIYAADGSRGLFRGHSATLLRIFPYAGIKFLAYEQIRAAVIKDKSQETPLRRFLSGSAAGTVSVFFTYPLEVIRVRLAFETKSKHRASLVDTCRTIYNEKPPPMRAAPIAVSDASAVAHAAASTISATSSAISKATPSSGLANFFRGFTPTLWGMLPYAGSSFLTHDTAGDLMRHPRIAKWTTLPTAQSRSRDPEKPAQLRYWAELFTGGFAGFVSQTVSYPLEVIRRRMQVGGIVGDGHRLGMSEVARTIHREAGWRGFFVGLAIGYVKIIPMSATSFYVYERGKLYLGI